MASQNHRGTPGRHEADQADIVTQADRETRLDEAKASAAAGEVDQAARHLRSLGILEDGSPETVPDIYVALGKGYYSAGDYGEAAAMLEAAVQSDPSFWEAHGLLGVLAEERFVSYYCLPPHCLGDIYEKELVPAIEAYRVAIELAPDRSKLRVRLARCLGYWQHYDDAESCYLSALEADPECEEAVLGLTYLCYNKAILEDPSLIGAGAKRAAAEQAATEVTEMASGFAERHEDSYRTRFVLEFIYRRLGMAPEAESELLRARECFRRLFSDAIDSRDCERIERSFNANRGVDASYLNPLILIEQYSSLATWLEEASMPERAEGVYLWLVGQLRSTCEGVTLVQRWLWHVFNDKVDEPCEGPEGGTYTPLDGVFTDALVQTLMSLASLHERMGQEEEAKGMYQQLLELPSTRAFGKAEEAPWWLFPECSLEEPHYRYDSLDRDRNNLEARLGLARIMGAKGEYGRLRENLGSIIDLGVNTALERLDPCDGLELEVAGSLLRWNLPAQAFNIAATALSKYSAHPVSPKPRRELSQAHWVAWGNILKAVLIAKRNLAAYSDCALMDPLVAACADHVEMEDAGGSFSGILALLHLRAGRFTTSSEVTERYLGTDPASDLLHLASVIPVLERGHFREVQQALVSCIDRIEDRRLPQYFLALTQAADGELSVAEDTLREMLEEHPTCAPARLALAVVRRQQGDAEDALGLVNEAIGEDPYLSEAYYQRMLLSLQSDNLGHAMDSLERALLVDPANPMARSQLADQFGRWLEQGQIEKIDASLQRVSRYLPGNEETIRTLLFSLTAVARFRAARHLEEVRTRLHSHKGYIRTVGLNIPLLKKQVGSLGEKYIDRISRACESGMKELTAVGRLLEVTAPKKQTESLNKVLLEAVEESQQRFVDAGCSIEYRATDPDPRVYIDRELVKTHVFHPIMANACDAMQSGGVLRIVADTGDEVVHLSFSDTGCGFPEGFDPESRSSSKGGEGWGIWLALRAMDAHGGGLDVGKAPDGGATVSVTFPMGGAPGLHPLEAAPHDSLEQTIERLAGLISSGLHQVADPAPLPPRPVMRPQMDVSSGRGIYAGLGADRLDIDSLDF